MPDVRAIDCWVNVSVGSSRERAPDYALRTAEGYFKRSKDFFKIFSADELVAIMDQVGVEKAIVTLPAENPSEKILAFPKAYLGRSEESDPYILNANCSLHPQSSLYHPRRP